MKFAFMREHRLEFHIEKMAKILGVCRSGYYEFLRRKDGKRSIENRRLVGHIQKIHQKYRSVYGSPRIHAELKRLGEKCSRKRVARLMRQENIQAKMVKKRKVIAKGKKESIAPNYLSRQFETETPNQKWVSDITYIHTEEGWVFVAIILDLFSRKVVGLSIGDRAETQLIIRALKQAIQRQKVSGGVMHHSDRGSQYTSREFQEFAASSGIKLSMSGQGNCYDNAVAESFFHTLKTEHTYFCRYRIREEAEASLFEYIEVFYNRQRLHSTLGYVTPEKFEENWRKGKERQAI